MINTRNTTLNQRPKAFNAVGVDIPIDIDFGMVVNPLMFVTKPCHSVVSGEFIGKQGGVRRYLTSHEGNKGVSFNIGGQLELRPCHLSGQHR